MGAAALSIQAGIGGEDWSGVVPGGYERLFYDGLDHRGELTGGQTISPVTADLAGVPVTPAPTTTLFVGQPMSTGQTGVQRRIGGENRINIVYVGDGYTAAELGAFADDVNDAIGGVFSVEPFASYMDYFAIHRVDVVSNESGVDNDPTRDLDRDTALDMEFWCNGIERLLCVDTSLAYSFANNVPNVDQVIALANSSKYGGAGYATSNVATSAANNSAAVNIVLHELGHSLGKLGDEYFNSQSSSTYTGNEPQLVNASTYDEATMAANGEKWAAWLGASEPGFDGTVGTFEGALYRRFGIYRPSERSMMRSLGRDFNLVSAEKILMEIYLEVEPIDSASDPTLDYGSTDVLSVTPMNVMGAPLGVQWSLNGAPIPGATGTTLDLAALNLPSGQAQVSVTVRDATLWVRDEAFRDDRMTQTIDYTVEGGWLTPACDATPNSVGPGANLAIYGSPSLADQDLTLEVTGGPIGAPILFFYGADVISTPLGEGTLCAGGITRRIGVQFFDLFGQCTYPIDFQADPVSVGASAILPGTSWIFQGWYRDTTSGGVPSFDFSSAVAATFVQ